MCLVDMAYSSGRVPLAVDVLNCYSANRTYCVSQNEIEETIKDSDHDPFANDHKNLVGRLIRDEHKLWQTLLDNKFCQKMRIASSGDIQVTKGFKWYMIQDFLYCARLMLFDTERSTKAPDVKTYEALTQKIESHTRYARKLLGVCTQELQIPERRVLQATREWATTQYTEFAIDVAESFDWVVSLIAMIPCVQSYYEIAKDLKEYSMHEDTIWYEHWVIPNSNEHSRQCTLKLKAFFVANYDTWRNIPYSKLRQIFREACQREIDLWAVGEEPGIVE